MDSITQKYHDTWREYGWAESDWAEYPRPTNPLGKRFDAWVMARRRLTDAATTGLIAEQHNPGCTVKPESWWQNELNRWKE